MPELLGGHRGTLDMKEEWTVKKALVEASQSGARCGH
jgi:hypothetical protein